MKQPLANKYRPKSLDDLIGQEVVVKTLKNSFNDWHHAYILEGKFGSGKTTVGRIMAAMDNCLEDDKPTLTPCGECDNCKAIFAGKSQDVKELDAASNRGIDDIREIRRESHFAPINSRMKYFLIDESHCLSGQAASAALKFIEEPPTNVRIVLATTDPQLLKDTIHSRCISLNFKSISNIELSNYIEKIAHLENIKISKEAANHISQNSNGSVRNALQNLQKVYNFTGCDEIILEDTHKALGTIDENLFFKLLDCINEIDVPSSMIILGQLITEGRNIDSIIRGLGSHLRKLSLARTCGKKVTELGFTEDEAKKYHHQSQKISPFLIDQMQDWMIDTQKAILVNLDPQQYLEKLIMKSIIHVVRSQK